MSNTWMQQDDEWCYISESPANGVCVGLCRKKKKDVPFMPLVCACITA